MMLNELIRRNKACQRRESPRCCLGARLDNDGLSRTVLVERKVPWVPIDPTNVHNDPASFNVTADRFLASYLHGPLGVIARTDEGSSDDPGDNRHHWQKSDAMGGNVGAKAERFAGTGERTTSLAAYDSFGNEVGPSLTDAGRYTWRGQEGTNHDRPARLVHMQAGHYDPGRVAHPLWG